MPTTTGNLQEIVRLPIRRTTVGAGLCRTCARAADCTFPRNPGHPVRSCDEFEGADGRPADRNPRIVATPIFPPDGAPAPRTAEMKGLCVQCARRHTCAYPKPAGGVWHCDELA